MYALASIAVSFRVTQYANQTGSAYTSVPPKAVHAVIPKSGLPGRHPRPGGAVAADREPPPPPTGSPSSTSSPARTTRPAAGQH